MSPVLISYIKAILRRAWGRSKQRQAALKAAKVSYGHYRCSDCKKTHRRRDIQVDHIIPVGRFNGFDGYIERLFCAVSGLSVKCKICHSIKTAQDIKKMKKPSRPRKVKLMKR